MAFSALWIPVEMFEVQLNLPSLRWYPECEKRIFVDRIFMRENPCCEPCVKS